MRWIFLTAAVSVLFAFRVAGAADAPPDARARTEAAWDAMEGSIRVATRFFAESNRWVRRAELARTEAFAQYALSRAEEARLNGQQESRRSTANWGQEPEVFRAIQRAQDRYVELTTSEVELFAATTETAAAHATRMDEGRVEVHDAAKRRGETRVAELRAEYLAGR